VTDISVIQINTPWWFWKAHSGGKCFRALFDNAQSCLYLGVKALGILGMMLYTACLLF